MTNSPTAQRMTRVAVIIGSTRPGRRGGAVAAWVNERARINATVMQGGAAVEILDIADFGLPLLDEPVPAMFGAYRHEHTRSWAAAVSSYDAFIFVTPEYNHSIPASLKNAIDYLYAEWNGKVGGVVSYGIQGGTRAADHLRAVLAEVRLVAVPSPVELNLLQDFDFAGSDDDDPTAAGVIAPAPERGVALDTMITELLGWAGAMGPLRDQAMAQAAG